VKRKYISLIIIALILVTCLVVGLNVVNTLRFRVVSSSPKNNIFPSSSSEIVYFFNKDLSDPSNDTFVTSVTPKINFSSYVDGRAFHIIFYSPRPEKFSVSINNLKSTTGSTISKLEKQYTVKYVPYKDLTEYEKNKEISKTDPIESAYPITKQLPIYSDYYIIKYQVSEGALNDLKNPRPLILKIKTLGINKLAPATDSYIQKVHQMALDDIRARGFNPGKFTIIFDDNPI
jgi:hypothetical protein